MNPHSPVRAVGQTRPGSTKVRKLAMLLAAMAASSQLAPTAALAQPAAPAPASTGTIQGRVLNAENGMYLNNARVTVEGTNIETFTNQYGEYTLNNVPVGSATLRVTYTGQEPQVNTVVVTSDTPAVQNISFNSDQSSLAEDGTLVLNEFTVAANRFRNAQELAINEQRASVNIKNVISVDQFGDIPSGNVGELVKFLPGVEIDYGSFGGNNQGYSDNDASGISVRGFGPEDTQILIDGMPVSNANPGDLTRRTALDQLSINNASRVELIKVPTPDMPANSIGGQINLITKTAFEQANPSYSGRIFFNINSLNASLEKTPGPVKDETYKTSPGVELSVTVPVTKNFGFSVTASAVNDANQSYRARPTWQVSGSGSAPTNDLGYASYSNPMLSRYQVTDTGSYVERQSGNIRLDWKPTPAQSLRVNAQYSTYESQEAQRRMDFRPNIAGTNVNNNVVGTDWGSNYTTGSSNNGVADMTVTTRDKEGETRSGQFQYKYSRFGWTIDVAGSSSISESDYNDRKNGHYSEIGLKLNPGPVNFNNFNDGGVVTSITTFNRANQGGGVRDFTQLANFGFDGTIAKSGEGRNKVTKNLMKIDVERDLSFLPFIGDNSLSLKIGARTDIEKTDKSGIGINYRQILRDGASYAVADILDTYYLGQELGFGLPAQQWGSTYKLYELNQANNLFYEPTGPEPTNTQVNNWNSYVGQQKAIKESIDAYYAQLSGRFFSNRLTFVGGFRQESREIDGYQPFTDPSWSYIKNPDGTRWRDETAAPNGVQYDRGNGTIDENGDWVPPANNGNRPIFMQTPTGDAIRAALAADGISIPKPLHPSSTHLSSRMLELQPMKYVHGEVKGDPSYSLSTAYKLTEKLDAKVAWSRTFGLPKLEDGANGLISNGFRVNDFTLEQMEDNGGFEGSIVIANPNQLPQVSDNWDFELSYYLASGGRLSASYYRKSVTNATMSIRTDRSSAIFFDLLQGMGFDQEAYGNYFITTTTNSSTKQKTDGWEFAVNHDFSFLGRWGRNFAMFGTFTLQSLGQPEVPRPYTFVRPDGSTETVSPTVGTITKRARRKASAGLQYSQARFSAQIRGVYKDANEESRTLIGPGNYLRTIQPSESRIDVSLNYVINKHFSLFLSGRDVFNAKRKKIREDDLGIYPSYAALDDYREFGVVWSTGVNAKF